MIHAKLSYGDVILCLIYLRRYTMHLDSTLLKNTFEFSIKKLQVTTTAWVVLTAFEVVVESRVDDRIESAVTERNVMRKERELVKPIRELQRITSA